MLRMAKSREREAEVRRTKQQLYGIMTMAMHNALRGSCERLLRAGNNPPMGAETTLPPRATNSTER